jgi:hypothetical protein
MNKKQNNTGTAILILFIAALLFNLWTIYSAGQPRRPQPYQYTAPPAATAAAPAGTYYDFDPSVETPSDYATRAAYNRATLATPPTYTSQPTPNAPGIWTYEPKIGAYVQVPIIGQPEPIYITRPAQTP